MTPKASNVCAVEFAREAGLRWVTDDGPGIRRLKSGKGFRYVDPDGKAVRDEDTLSRIRSLAIPPAYKDVWICPHHNGHLQATGIDDRGRKQPRYHPKWREARDENKYGHMLEFGAALPKIRAATEKHLALPGMPREKILATVVQLLEKTHIRVGNEEYARTNKSRGLTTMQTRNVAVKGATVTFCFKGKSGVKHCIDLQDRRIAAIVRKLTDLPGQDVFQYIDSSGETHSVGSSDVNAYIKEISGGAFTAKDFRTWAGTVSAACALHQYDAFTSQTEAKKNVVAAIDGVAKELGNTRSVCRKCYVHPAIVDAYMEGTLEETIARCSAASERSLRKLQPEEKDVMRLLVASTGKK